MKNVSQRISLIREVRKWEKCRSKEKKETGQNSNSLGNKQNQGLLVPPQWLQVIFWAILYCELLETPEAEKLTIEWPDCSCEVSCHSSKNWPQRNRNKPTLGLKPYCTTIKMTLVRAMMTNFKTSVRTDCAISDVAPPSTYSSSCSQLLWVGVDRCTGRYLPHRLLAPKIKQTFRCMKLVFSLVFEWGAARPHFQLH